jgi:hypothetical protein
MLQRTMREALRAPFFGGLGTSIPARRNGAKNAQVCSLMHSSAGKTSKNPLLGKIF